MHEYSHENNFDNYYGVIMKKEVAHEIKHKRFNVSCFKVFSEKPDSRRMKCIRGT